MNSFKTCIVCKLILPISMMIPVDVIHKGKKIRVGICERCKKIKEEEAKRRR